MIKLRLWWKRLRHRQPRVIFQRMIYSDSMPLPDWQKNPDRILSIRKWFATLDFKEAMAVLHSQHPTRDPASRDATTSLVHYGMTLGYQRCIDTLLSLGAFPVDAPEMVEADYGADAILKEEGLADDKGESK